MGKYIATNHNGTPIMRTFGSIEECVKEAKEYQYQTGNGWMIFTEEEFYTTDEIMDSQRKWVE